MCNFSEDNKITAAVEKCAKQTAMQEEYPRNDGKSKQSVCIEYKFQRQPVKLFDSEDGCNMFIFSLPDDEMGCVPNFNNRLLT